MKDTRLICMLNKNGIIRLNGFCCWASYRMYQCVCSYLAGTSKKDNAWLLITNASILNLRLLPSENIFFFWSLIVLSKHFICSRELFFKWHPLLLCEINIYTEINVLIFGIYIFNVKYKEDLQSNESGHTCLYDACQYD